MPSQAKTMVNKFPVNLYMARSFASGVIFLAYSGSAYAQGYTNVAPQQGLDFTVPYTYYDYGTGVSFHDFDGDGWDDLSFGNVEGQLLFYRNVQGTLQAVPLEIDGLADTKMVLWADIDNDGDSDLLVTTYEGPVRLFRNDGNWVFTDITVGSGLLQEYGGRWGASFGDYNKDGFLDLYVCTYYDNPAIPYTYNNVNHLYQNNGNCTFTDVTLSAGVDDGLKASFQSTWVDFDWDGWPDLYVINDFEASNSLFRNNGDGTFTDMAEQLGLAEPGEHCMSISMADFDLDGDLDIFVTNTGIFPETNNARSMLLVNDGNGSFSELSTNYGLDIFEWGWGGLWVDHDNDGYVDLYVATHRETSAPVANLFFVNESGIEFTERTDLFPDAQIMSSHSVARGDLNGDGYADIVVHNQHPYPPMLYVNNGGGSHFVRIGVEGTVSNRQGIGTWIRVHSGAMVHTHYTVCGENYLGQSSQYILFGLDDATIIDSVEVQYLSGHVDRYYDLEVDQTYLFTEGETYEVVVTTNGSLVVCAPDSVLLDAGEHAFYLWNTGDTTRTIVVHGTGSYSVTAGTIPGLEATSGSIVVTVSAPPVIVAAVTDPFCAGDSTGSIVLTNLVGTELIWVTWVPYAEGESPNGLFAGVYTYTVEDVNGCSGSGLVELIDPDPMFVLVDVTPESEGSDGAINWSIFGGSPPYLVQLDGATVEGNSASDLGSGILQLLVTDSQGCEVLNEVVVGSTVGLAPAQERQALHLYPNPTAEILWFNSQEHIVAWEVMDSAGRTVLHGRDVGHYRSLHVGSLSAGAYMLQVSTGQGRQIRARFQKVPTH